MTFCSLEKKEVKMTSVLEKFLFEQMMVLKDNTGKTVFELWLTKKDKIHKMTELVESYNEKKSIGGHIIMRWVPKSMIMTFITVKSPIKGLWTKGQSPLFDLKSTMANKGLLTKSLF